MCNNCGRCCMKKDGIFIGGFFKSSKIYISNKYMNRFEANKLFQKTCFLKQIPCNLVFINFLKIKIHKNI